MTSDGTWTYTWEHGRELATMSNGGATWRNTYNADGLRTRRTNLLTVYNYIYNGSSLSQMTVSRTLGSNTATTLYFTYDASGTPMSVTYNGTNYYYATNIQGDVTAILDTSGTAVVEYTYDAWGKILTTTGSMASTLGKHNPLRYRGYVYDTETGLYYLQSRYYDPKVGRFLNADAFTSTGQGLLGNNMFTYCQNNPVNLVDPSGDFPWGVVLPIAIPALINGVTRGISAWITSGSIRDAGIEFLIGLADGALSSFSTWFGYIIAAFDTAKTITEFKSNGASDLEAITAGGVSLLGGMGFGSTGDKIVDYFVDAIFGFGKSLSIDGSIEAWKRNIQDNQIVFSPTSNSIPSSIRNTGRNSGSGGSSAVCYIAFSY